MNQSDEAWNEVGEQFKKLGSVFRHHYEAQSESEEEAVSDDDVAAAVQTIGESIKTAVRAVGDTVNDPNLAAETRRTAGSFFDALGATFSDLGAEITKRGEDPASSPPEVEPTDEAPSPEDE